MATFPHLQCKANGFSLSPIAIALTAGLLTLSTMTVSAENVNDDLNSNVDFADSDEINAKSDFIERMQIIGHSDKLRTEAGSATLIGEAELEKFKFDDINRVLYNVPGINIREEDGFGLRPNIGFRGATPERSKKITIMEDGILSGPAPYSAPAAYYFPMMSKMTSVEVFKGPAATKYGPNTVAGALNMTTRAVPNAQEGMIDLALGTDGYSKVHGFYGDNIGNFGFLIEGINMQSDGFKELDGSVNVDNTGFDKNDLMAKFRYDLSTDAAEHTFALKLAYADENSNETYLGLTDEDFAQTPNRRYVASQLDNMDWQHQQVQFTHFVQTNNFDITTHVYRNEFERSWFKINGFKGGPTLQTILENPNDQDGDFINQGFYQILTGQQDSITENQKIILGDNAREYYSQGIQSELHFEQSLFGFTHKFNAGVRFHQDQIERNHTKDSFFMRSMQLVSDGSDQVAATTDREKTEAIAVFLQDTIKVNALDVTLGLRGEFIDSTYQNRELGEEDDWQKKSSHIWLPSLSLFYTLNDNAGLLFGVHEGFVPTTPKEGIEVDIENSVNYEFGGRYNDGNYAVEAVVFYNDMSNLKEACSFSSCGDNSDTEFNGSEVDVYGLEFTTSAQFALTKHIDMPVSVVYTYSDSEFKTSFDSDFSMWGTIIAGDSVPYLPEHQLTLNIGLAGDNWDVNLIARYLDEMLEASGTGVTLEGYTTKAYSVVDLSASYYLRGLGFGDIGKLYFKADNIFDTEEIVSRRPYGARPSKAQQMFVGYQYNF
ncbi:TonB-dependent receptor family protein [Colwelliaceae bacterium MEBiC 14330]